MATDTLDRLRKILALASDERGEPHTRAAAKKKLEELRSAYPAEYRRAMGEPKPPRVRQARVAGVDPSDEWKAHKFFDLNLWNETSKGNRSIGVQDVDGRNWRYVVFKYQTGEVGWMRYDRDDDDPPPEYTKRRFKEYDDALMDIWEELGH